MTDKPNTVTIELRCSIEALATIARYFMTQGVYSATKGGLARTAVETFSAVLVSQRKVLPVTSIEEAVDILHRLGLTSLNRSSPMKASLLGELAAEAEAGITAEDVLSELARQQEPGAS